MLPKFLRTGTPSGIVRRTGEMLPRFLRSGTLPGRDSKALSSISNCSGDSRSCASEDFGNGLKQPNANSVLLRSENSDTISAKASLLSPFKEPEIVEADEKGLKH